MAATLTHFHAYTIWKTTFLVSDLWGFLVEVQPIVELKLVSQFRSKVTSVKNATLMIHYLRVFPLWFTRCFHKSRAFSWMKLKEVRFFVTVHWQQVTWIDTEIGKIDCLDYAGRYFATLRVLQATNERVNLAAYGILLTCSILLNYSSLADNYYLWITISDENVGLIDERPVLNRLRKLFAQVKAVFNSMEHIPEILQEYDPI